MAGMGIPDSWPGKGVSTAIMERLLAQARGQGDSRVLLEVIEQHPPPLRKARVRENEAAGGL